MVYEPPLLGAISANAFGSGAEDVGKVAAHLALVDQPSQPARSGQHAQQRDLRQAHGRGAVVDHRDLVAGERQFVAAAGRRAVQRGEELEARVAARILDTVAGLVGEFAEVDLPRVRALTEHVDVRARAEHARLARGHHHGFHPRMLEPDPVQRIVQLDVHAQVVGVELELVGREEPLVLLDVERERGDGAVDRQLPVVVLLGVRIECDHRGPGVYGAWCVAFLSSVRLCRTVRPALSTVTSACA